MLRHKWPIYSQDELVVCHHCGKKVPQESRIKCSGFSAGQGCWKVVCSHCQRTTHFDRREEVGTD